VSLEKYETNTRDLWSWKDFPVYKYYEIPFDAYIAKIALILILSANFSSRNGDFLFLLKKLNYCPRRMVNIYI